MSARWPHVTPPEVVLPDRARDAEDPRALDLLAPWTDAEPPRFGLLGVPFDGAVAGRKGAAEGPAGIREAFRFASTYHWETDTELDGQPVGDVGDVAVLDHDTATTHAHVRKAVAALLSDGVDPFVLGGDNSITWATVAGLLDATEGRVGIVDLDAHLDVRQARPVVNSGTPFRRILTDFPGRVAAANVAQIGHRQFANARAYRRWAEGRGVRIFDMERVRSQGFAAVLEAAVEAASDGTDHLVLTIDMDALDHVHAPGVSAPTPSGLGPLDLFAAMRALGREPRTRFAELVEVAPPLDPAGGTARLAAVAVLEYLVAWSTRAKRS